MSGWRAAVRIAIRIEFLLPAKFLQNMFAITFTIVHCSCLPKAKSLKSVSVVVPYTRSPLSATWSGSRSSLNVLSSLPSIRGWTRQFFIGLHIASLLENKRERRRRPKCSKFPNHKLQIASDFKSRSPNRKSIPQITVKNASNRRSKSQRRALQIWFDFWFD